MTDDDASRLDRYGAALWQIANGKMDGSGRRRHAQRALAGRTPQFVAVMIHKLKAADARIEALAAKVEKLARERDEAVAEVERLREAMRPFAKAAELFGPSDPEGFDMLIYGPAAGDDYKIVGNDLRRARAAVERAVIAKLKGEG